MYEKLPREVRDLVYKYFWARHGGLLEWLRVWYPSLLLGRTSHSPFDQLCAEIYPIDSRISTELVQWYYENHPDDLGIGQMIEMPSWYPGSTHSGSKCLLEALDLHDLAKFMSKDVFGVGTTPSHCKLRALTVRIDLADYTSEWRVDELLAPIFTQNKSKGFRLSVNVVGWWNKHFDFDIISSLGSKLKEAFDRLAAEGMTASARLTLFVAERRRLRPERIIFEDVGDMLGASEDGWEEFLMERLKRRD